MWVPGRLARACAARYASGRRWQATVLLLITDACHLPGTTPAGTTPHPTQRGRPHSEMRVAKSKIIFIFKDVVEINCRSSWQHSAVLIEQHRRADTPL